MGLWGRGVGIWDGGGERELGLGVVSGLGGIGVSIGGSGFALSCPRSEVKGTLEKMCG